MHQVGDYLQLPVIKFPARWVIVSEVAPHQDAAWLQAVTQLLTPVNQLFTVVRRHVSRNAARHDHSLKIHMVSDMEPFTHYITALIFFVKFRIPNILLWHHSRRALARLHIWQQSFTFALQVDNRGGAQKMMSEFCKKETGTMFILSKL